MYGTEQILSYLGAVQLCKPVSERMDWQIFTLQINLTSPLSHTRTHTHAHKGLMTNLTAVTHTGRQVIIKWDTISEATIIWRRRQSRVSNFPHHKRLSTREQVWIQSEANKCSTSASRGHMLPLSHTFTEPSYSLRLWTVTLTHATCFNMIDLSLQSLHNDTVTVIISFYLVDLFYAT